MRWRQATCYACKTFRSLESLWDFEIGGGENFRNFRRVFLGVRPLQQEFNLSSRCQSCRGLGTERKRRLPTLFAGSRPVCGANAPGRRRQAVTTTTPRAHAGGGDCRSARIARWCHLRGCPASRIEKDVLRTMTRPRRSGDVEPVTVTRCARWPGVGSGGIGAVRRACCCKDSVRRGHGVPRDGGGAQRDHLKRRRLAGARRGSADAGKHQCGHQPEMSGFR